MKLSIITINFNNRLGLEHTIKSVTGQTYMDFEYLVIDGESNDGSKEIIEKYSENISYWVSESDKGIYNAMNKGIKQAKGEYLLFLNSGDIFSKNTILENVSENLENCPIIYGDGMIKKDTGELEKVIIPKNLTLEYFSSRSLFHPATFIKKELFKEYGLYNENYKIVSDWEFFLKAIFINNVEVKKINFFISIIEEGGISRDAKNQSLLTKEVNDILQHYFPASVIKLIAMFQEQKKEMNALIAEGDKLKKELLFYQKNYIIRMVSKLLKLRRK